MFCFVFRADVTPPILNCPPDRVIFALAGQSKAELHWEDWEPVKVKIYPRLSTRIWLIREKINEHETIIIEDLIFGKKKKWSLY